MKTQEQSIAQAAQHGWRLGVLAARSFGRMVGTTLVHTDRHGRRYAITVLRDGTFYGAHGQAGR